jgi:hypothetical protein
MFLTVSPPIIRSYVQFLSFWWWAGKQPETCRALTAIMNIVLRCVLLIIISIHSKKIVLECLLLYSLRLNSIHPSSCLPPPIHTHTSTRTKTADSIVTVFLSNQINVNFYGEALGILCKIRQTYSTLIRGGWNLLRIITSSEMNTLNFKLRWDSAVTWQ